MAGFSRVSLGFRFHKLKAGPTVLWRCERALYDALSDYRKMKKIISAGIVLAVGAYAVGLKSHNFVRDKIHSPFKSSISQKTTQASYKQVLCPKDGITLATFGQSNSANYVEPLANVKIPRNLLQYDWRTEKCYEYREPLLGTDGSGGNIVTYTAVRIAENSSKPIVVISFGVGGSSVLEWAYGWLSYQLDFALSSLNDSGLSPKIFLWHQGEIDARFEGSHPDNLKKVPYIQPGNKQFGLGRRSYADALQAVVDKTKQYFPNSHFGIALVSRCININQWEPIREAQREIANRNKNSFISVDSDQIYSEKTRYDKCHFSNEGAREVGNQYYTSISTLLK
jgi:hypothetical protein